MAKACEWLARLSGWAGGACLVLALMTVSGEVRADEGGNGTIDGSDCVECDRPWMEGYEPTPEELAEQEACMVNCLAHICDVNCNGTAGYPHCSGRCNKNNNPACAGVGCRPNHVTLDCDCK